MGKVKERLVFQGETNPVHPVIWPGKPAHETGRPTEDAGYLFELKDVPQEVRAAAQYRFGADLKMSTPRGNGPGYGAGGMYRGEVFNTEDYLIQEVAPRSVMFHRKDKLVFFSDRLRWADDHQRLNGTDVQIAYDGDRPEVYPWNRARDRLTGVVASLKKSAKELGMTDLASHDGVLDQLEAHTWHRIRERRRAAQDARQSGNDLADRDVVR